ncbi:MAG: phosphoribosylformylglycinamidine cyclo-ligase [Bacillota bacterium]
MTDQRWTYARSGVDVAAGDRAVELMKAHVVRTHRAGVLGAIGGFGGLFAPDLAGCREPVLVSGTDGVGTKLKLAFAMDKHDTVGQDVVAMCVNDILTLGAEPLFFLDYIATGRLEPEKVADIVKGVSDGCVLASCALIGGETAEMPGFYPDGEYDLAGFAVGLVDKARIIDGSTVAPGDAIIGLASSGPHSNGFSLYRRLLLEEKGYGLDQILPELDRSLGETLLEPTRIYVKPILSLLKKVLVKGMAHITGGGITGNLPRVLPEGTAARLTIGRWPIPPLFHLVEREGEIGWEEMLATFNCGLGYLVIVPGAAAALALAALEEAGQEAWLVGEVIPGDGAVHYAWPGGSE